jgi:hypothetical protein
MGAANVIVLFMRLCQQYLWALLAVLFLLFSCLAYFYDPEDRGSTIFQTVCDRLADFFIFQTIVLRIITAVRISKPTDGYSPHIPVYL